MKNILITGGAGFIGSHLVKRFVKNYPSYNIYNVDSLTYAGNLNNLKDYLNILLHLLLFQQCLTLKFCIKFRDSCK